MCRIVIRMSSLKEADRVGKSTLRIFLESASTSLLSRMSSSLGPNLLSASIWWAMSWLLGRVSDSILITFAIILSLSGSPSDLRRALDLPFCESEGEAVTGRISLWYLLLLLLLLLLAISGGGCLSLLGDLGSGSATRFWEPCRDRWAEFGSNGVKNWLKTEEINCWWLLSPAEKSG